jgi:hypothetical protein
MQLKVDLILQEPVVVINVGPSGFAESLEAQGAVVTQVDWVPPAAGDQEMIDLLEDLM